MIALHVLSFSLGLFLVLAALNAAIVTFLLPRPAAPKITRFVFRVLRRVINGLCHLAPGLH